MMSILRSSARHSSASCRFLREALLDARLAAQHSNASCYKRSGGYWAALSLSFHRISICYTYSLFYVYEHN